MGLLNRIKMLWRAAVGSSYSWPAMDIVLPGERYLHLVGSIHMGTRDMRAAGKASEKNTPGRCVNRRGRYQRQ